MQLSLNDNNIIQIKEVMSLSGNEQNMSPNEKEEGWVKIKCLNYTLA